MASRFWVGGTGNWDASTTTNWSATSGGAGGASVPGSSDTVTINGSSGAGTITVTTNFSILDLTTGAMGMTLDFGATTPTIAGNGWVNNGTGTRTISFGTSNVTVSAAGANTGIDWGVTTNLTLSANTATLTISGASTGTRLIDFGGSALSNMPSIVIGANSSRGAYQFSGPTMTIPTLTINAPTYMTWSTSNITLTNLVLSGGSTTNPIQLQTNQNGTQRTIPLTNSATGTGLMIRELNTSTGTITGTNSIDLGRNGANIILTAPSGGGGVVGVIGG